ncbi:MAG: AbrB/MazE/SpoVT family DNA-binding domain-containing protein [Deltaproteobacteria bacterium]|nr:AbrB/MazE/SpoVT family DNA-binding domain-containing protein [Deltaproteobacteria bacterium]
MPIVKLSSKGQIVVPKEIRDALKIKPLQKVFLKMVRDRAELIPLPQDPVHAFCGVFEKGPSLTMALLKERGQEALIEEKKGA